jgi:serine/threonine-protein kinase RsbW
MSENAPHPCTLRLDVASRFDMLDLVHDVVVRLAELAGFDEDAQHYLNVAVRESVVNAIKHGNRLDERKRVEVRFVLQGGRLEVEIQDEGRGFDPAGVPDPLAPENLLKVDGRGIFFMRSFVDELAWRFPPQGGTVVHMVKSVKPGR